MSDRFAVPKLLFDRGENLLLLSALGAPTNIAVSVEHTTKVFSVHYRRRQFVTRAEWKFVPFMSSRQANQHNGFSLKPNTVMSCTDYFNVNNTKVTNPKYISEGFCSCFTNVGRDLASKISDLKKLYIPLTWNIETSILLRPTDPFEIFKIITNMKVKKSSGCDDILCILLKKLKYEISLAVSTLVNKSLEGGIVPKSIKVAKAVPIYKSI